MRPKKMLSIHCREDDTLMQANSEDELVLLYQDHMNSSHGETMTEEEARQEVEEILEEEGEEMF